MSPRPNPARLSCVMPAFNEAGSLPRTVPAALAALRALSPQIELLLVDDGSVDGTVQIAEALCAAHPELVLLRLSRNFGKEAALSAGLDQARGDAVFIMDADGQHPTALLPAMLDAWHAGADVAYAVRRRRSDQGPLQRLLTRLFYRLLNWHARVQVPPDAGDFRLLDARVVRALREMPERHRFMKGLYAWVGFRSVALDYEPLPRAEGRTRFGLGGAFGLGVTGLLSFSAMPLRVMGAAGGALALLAFVYGLWVIAEYFFLGIRVSGYATIVVGMMFLAGVQLMALGLLSEYVARIYDEVKRRPLYLLAERRGAGLPVDGKP